MGTAAVSYVIAPAMSVGVSTDKAVYAKGQTVTMKAVVRAGGVPVAGKLVTFAVTRADGSVMTQTATTNTTGTATSKLQVRKQDRAGTYRLRATTTAGTVSASGTTTFAVQ